MSQESAYNFRFEGYFEFAEFECLPVEIFEKGLIFDGGLSAVCLDTSESLGGVLGHESLENTHGLPGEPDGVEHVVVQNGLEQVLLVVRLERRLPRHHLVHQHAQGPPVNRRPVVQLLQNLQIHNSSSLSRFFQEISGS